MDLRRWRLDRTDALWLFGQLVVFVLAFVVVPTLDGGPGRLDLPGVQVVGPALMVAGAVFSGWAMATLGRQLVPQPTPITGGTLVEHGPYRLVRHPIYTGVVLLVAGSLLRVASLTGAVLLALSLLFFSGKSSHEESLLLQAYPDYAGLQQRVRWRVLPGVF